MTIQAQSADGMIHEFPDGTADAIVDKAMKQYASSTQPPSMAADVAKSAGIGFAKGGIGLVGLPGDIEGLARKGINYVSPGAVGQSPFLPPSSRIQNAIEGVTGQFYQPQTTAGKYAETLGEFAPAAISPGSVARRVAQVAIPGLASETAGQLTEGTAAEPYARIAAGGLGALATGTLGNVGRRLVTPAGAIPAERQAAVNTLRNEGVTDLTPGDITGSDRIKAAERELGGGRYVAAKENQAEQFTRAALARVGENSNRATPDVIDNAFNRIGAQFDQIGARNTLQTDRQLANDVANTQADYRYFANPGAKTTFDSAVNDIVDLIQRNNGVIPGAQYNALRSRLGATARASVSDNQQRQAFYGLQGALDDAMERSMRAAGNHADIADLNTARNQYRNLLTIERAASTNAGALGLISPSALKNAETVTQGRRGYARGTGDFSQLSRAGTAVMTPLPTSNTPFIQTVKELGMSPVTAGMGAALGSHFGPLGTVAGAVAGGYAPRGLGRLAMSPLGRAYLTDQAMAGPLRPNALLQQLLLGLQGGARHPLQITVRPSDATGLLPPTGANSNIQ